MRSDLDYRATATNAALEGASLAAQALLFGFGFLPSRHKTLRAESLHTVVFVHGLGANRASLYPVQAYLAARGHRRQYSFSYPTIGSIESCAVALKERIDRDVKGGRIDLVCHSLGGLVGRFYVQQLDGARRVHRMVTLATPNQGTHATAWLPTTVVRQMTPGSPFLTHLNGLPAPQGVQLTSFGVDADLLVLPPTNAKAPFGAHHQHPRLGHTGLLFSPTVLRQTFEALGPSCDGVPVVRQAGVAKQIGSD
jgi:pimeloyl-ACP methyl ester carboxylesterase